MSELTPSPRKQKSLLPLTLPSQTQSYNPSPVDKTFICSSPYSPGDFPDSGLLKKISDEKLNKKMALPDIRSPPQQKSNRGHRRGLGSRGSFDHSSTMTSFDSSESLLSEENIIGNGVGFSSKQIRMMFPFHIAVNYDFQIVQLGNSLLSYMKNNTLVKIPTYDHIGKYFRILSPKKTNWDWQSLNGSGKETVLELELSKDYLLSDSSSSVRFSGILHRIHPKEDNEALSFTAFFLIEPTANSKELFAPSHGSADNCFSPLQSDYFDLKVEHALLRNKCKDQQDLISKLEAEIQTLKLSSVESQQIVMTYSTSSNSLLNFTEPEEKSLEPPQLDVRQLIGNVTHDLKTPLSGFLSGIESVRDYAQELLAAVELLRQNRHKFLQKGGMTEEDDESHFESLLDAMDGKIQHIQHKVKDINDINNFMTMTINRCIEYAKLGQNLKLKPKLETVDLVESLYLPLNCMKSLQSRISINLEPIDPAICPSVITDKQWLQENLLCLLSNAVKYSHRGEIAVRMFHFNSSLIAEVEDVCANLRPTSAQLQQLLSSKANRTNGISRTTSLIQSPLHRIRAKSLTIEDSRANSVTPTHRYNHSLDLARVSSLVFSEDRSFEEGLSSKTLNTYDSFDCATTAVSFSNRTLSLDIPQIDFEQFTSEFLIFEVEDSGTGIKEETRENLFNPFQQAQKLAGGTGLGLFSLAKRVEALHGLYGVEGRRDGNRGSLFWFAIPYRPDVEASKFRASSKFADLLVDLNNPTGLPTNSSLNPASQHKLVKLQSMKTQKLLDMCRPSSATSRTDSAKSLHVLVVDDSVTITKTVRFALLRKGYSVDQAHNGLDALEKIFAKLESTEKPYDVILMDLNMPVLDGLEATRRLRQTEEEKFPDKKHVIIGMSANSDEDTIVEAVSAGVDDFICKPFSMETFANTLQKFSIA